MRLNLASAALVLVLLAAGGAVRTLRSAPPGDAVHRGLKEQLWRLRLENTGLQAQLLEQEKARQHLITAASRSLSMIEPAAAGRNESPDDSIHVVFSTSCDVYSEWQAYTLVHSHLVAGQRGRITHLVSCSTQDPGCLRCSPPTYDWHPRAAVMLVPPWPQGQWDRERPVLSMNKPMGFTHWIKHRDPAHGGQYILLLDPDMVIVRPLTLAEFPVRPGGPVFASRSAYAAEYLQAGRRLCDSGSCDAISPADAAGLFAVGPPLFLHVRDAQRIASLWLRICMGFRNHPQRDVAEQAGGLTDMYGWSLAAIQLRLRHEPSHLIVAGNPRQPNEADERGLSFINAFGGDLSGVGDPTRKSQDERWDEGLLLKPHVIHYYQRLTVGDYDFYKTAHRHTSLLSCVPSDPHPPQSVGGSSADLRAAPDRYPFLQPEPGWLLRLYHEVRRRPDWRTTLRTAFMYRELTQRLAAAIDRWRLRHC